MARASDAYAPRWRTVPAVRTPCPYGQHAHQRRGKIMRLRPTTIGVRDEYAPTFGRQNLTLWSGAFYSDHEGWARELPGHDGYMITLYSGPKVRVACEAPRTEQNYQRVDAAIVAAITALDATS